ncbi:DUF2913 family protein [Ferrimonas pelagia]|uniref:DUF2913 family protein n=1 Tax=Ferrimonas pelagia TaxID=1177826 RepID=A0ABP9EEK2_9GAMM
MSSRFNFEIYTLATTGLTELAQAQESGRVPRAPISEAHYFSAWVTRAIKQQRFAHSTAKQLKAWQKQARTQGKGAALKDLFERIAAIYGPLLHGTEEMAMVTMRQLEALAEEADAAGWVVEPEEVIDGPFIHHTDGQGSLVLCAKQQQTHFLNDDELIKPISLYLRGDMSAFIAMAYRHGLLLHKVTDYKSLVKYHGEYLLYPANAGPILAELPALID